MQDLALIEPGYWKPVTHNILEHHVLGLPTIENGFGDIRGEEGKFENASDVTLGEFLLARDLTHRTHLSGHQFLKPSVGPDDTVDKGWIHLRVLWIRLVGDHELHLHPPWPELHGDDHLVVFIAKGSVLFTHLQKAANG